MKQRTLKSEVRCSGVGLHSGRKVGLVIKPAPADAGVRFVQGNSRTGRSISLDPQIVLATGLATTIGGHGGSVSTVEHLLAALVGLEVDNALIEVDGEEVPILDGSAAVFVYLIQTVGLQELESPRRVAKICKPLLFEHDGKKIAAFPYNGLKIDYSISFAHPQIGRQFFSYTSSPQQFVAKICRARTFGFMKDVESLQRKGLALGGSLDNAVVFDDYGVVNPEGLRFSDEMVRHKILDFMGDVAVYKFRLWGHFSVSCSGHEFNNRFMRYLADHADEYLDIIDTAVGSKLAPREAPNFAAGVPAWA